MTEWEMEKLAGEAIGLDLDGVEGRDAFLWVRGTGEIWIPLGDGDQAMRLVSGLNLHIDQRPGKQISVQPPCLSEMVVYEVRKGEALDLNRAIVACAALMRRKGIKP